MPSLRTTQNEGAATEQAAVAETTTVADDDAEATIAGESMHHVMMQKFLEGGWEWMLPVLLCLVLGLAIAIERILYLSLSTINSKKFLAQIEEALKNGGIDAAMEVARNTRGPIASIYYQGLSRYGQGLDAVEKSVVSYGSVQTGLMESGLSLDRSVHRPVADVGIHGYRRRYDRGVRRHPGCRRYLPDAGCRRYQGRSVDYSYGSYRSRYSPAVL